MPSYSIDIHDDADTRVVVLAGELDLAATDAMRQAGTTAIREETVRRLVVDLSGVSFIDSSAIGALIEVRRAGQALGKDTVLRHPSERVQKVLWIASLDTMFTIDGDADGDSVA
jgi:anti-anti-sigma factor